MKIAHPRIRLTFRSTSLAVMCFVLGSCAAPEFDVKAMVREWGNYMQSDYVLRANDEITITVRPDGPTQTLVVPPTGTVTLLRMPEPLVAVGKPIRTFRAECVKAYSAVFQDTVRVYVSLTKPSASSIFVIGQVGQPGIVAYTPAMTLAQAVSAAGGFLVGAKLADVRVVRLSENGTPKTHRVNLHAVLHDDGPGFLVLPGDVVYCQTLWIVDVADTLRLYFWNLLPFNPSSAAAF